MSIDALSYSIIISELNNSLSGGKITKIIQPEKDEILLNIYNNRENLRLVLSVNSSVCRMHLTNLPLTAPITAPTFCMLLRKHLTNAVIESVTSQPFERVADFTLAGTNDLGYPYIRHLIIELTGKTGNIILTDDNYMILDTLKRVALDMERERQFFAGSKYSFFAPQDKIKPNDIISLKALIERSENPINALTMSTLGASKDTINEILYKLDDTKPKTEGLVIEILERYSEYMKNINSPTPNVISDKNGVLIDVLPFVYQSIKGEHKFFPTLNEAFDYFYSEKDTQQRFREKSKHIATVIKNAKARTEKKIALQREAMINSEKNVELTKFGNLILSNIYRLHKGDIKATVEDFYTDNSEITIALDENKTPQQNADTFFKAATKLKKTAEYTAVMLSENEEMLTYLISLSESLKYSTSYGDLEEIYRELIVNGLLRGNDKKETTQKSSSKKALKIPETSPLCYNIDGFKVYVGKNNFQN
ncbi:MAG: NFACT family protein, partial [Clostridia bacterium]